MNQNLENLIKNLVQEYTGTGASGFPGGKGGDGNRITSPRIGGSFRDDEEEIMNYVLKMYMEEMEDIMYMNLLLEVLLLETQEEECLN